jgi:hypothetical protein
MYLQGYQDGVSFADYAYNHRSLLYSFRCIFDLEDSALRRALKY